MSLVNKNQVLPVCLVTMVLFFIIGYMTGCGDTNDSVEPVKFSRVYTEVLSAHCVPCHSPGKSGNLTWTDEASAYNAFVLPAPNGQVCENVAFPLVDDHSSEVSLLANKLTPGAVCGMVMPPKGLLSDEQVQLVKDWIDTGHKR